MRKLATAALAFSAAIFLANYVLPESLLLIMALLFAVSGGLLALLHRRWLRPAVIALLFFSLGLLEYSVFCRLTLDRAAEYAGQTREVEGVVLDYPDVYDSYARLYIRMDSEGLPRFKAIVYDNKKSLSAAQPGDRVSLTAKLSTADTLYGKPYDNYHIKGIYLKLSMQGEGELTRGGFSIGTLPVRLRQFLCERADRLFPADSRAFLKALMLGDKEDFYADDALYVSMSRSGLMHVVAVSGLHISFLVGLTVLLFGNGRTGALLSIALVWCFALVTGAGSSVLRASFMQTLLLLAPILRRENDPITALSAVLAMLLAACPFAARSVSLQLSFAAMSGILCFGERLYEGLMRPIPDLARIMPVRYAVGVIASSLSVTVFTTPLTAAHFSYVPLLAVFSNIVCLWAVSVCFCMAWLSCLLSLIPALGAAVGAVCALLVRYILFCARTVSGIPWSVLYLKTRGALVWMSASYLLLPLGLLLRKRPVLRVLLPASLSLALLAGILLRSARFYREYDCVSVLDVGQGQCITAFAGDVTAVIDCGNINNLDNAGSIAGEYLLSCGRRSIEILMLTHLHSDHADGAVRLMELLPVNTLILPADADDGDGVYARILDAAARHGTRLEMIDGNARASCGGLRLQLYKSADTGDVNERCLMASLALGERELLVTGDAPKKVERMLAEQADLSGTDILIVGHHGSKKASSAELLKEVGGGLAVISAGYNNYGHPARETLDALREYGYEILRTDEVGTVEICMEKTDGETIGKR